LPFRWSLGPADSIPQSDFPEDIPHNDSPLPGSLLYQLQCSAVEDGDLSPATSSALSDVAGNDQNTQAPIQITIHEPSPARDSTLLSPGDATSGLAQDSTLLSLWDATSGLARDSTLLSPGDAMSGRWSRSYRRSGDATSGLARDSTLLSPGDATSGLARDSTLLSPRDATSGLARDSTLLSPGDATSGLARDSTLLSPGDATSGRWSRSHGRSASSSSRSSSSPVPPFDWDQSSVGSDLEELSPSSEDWTHNDLLPNTQRQGSPLLGSFLGSIQSLHLGRDASGPVERPADVQPFRKNPRGLEPDVVGGAHLRGEVGVFHRDDQLGLDGEGEARPVISSPAGVRASRSRRKESNKPGAHICRFCGRDFTAKHNLTGQSRYPMY
jgi:hypothetical protein